MNLCPSPPLTRCVTLTCYLTTVNISFLIYEMGITNEDYGAYNETMTKGGKCLARRFSLSAG